MLLFFLKTSFLVWYGGVVDFSFQHSTAFSFLIMISQLIALTLLLVSGSLSVLAESDATCTFQLPPELDESNTEDHSSEGCGCSSIGRDSVVSDSPEVPNSDFVVSSKDNIEDSVTCCGTVASRVNFTN